VADGQFVEEVPQELGRRFACDVRQPLPQVQQAAAQLADRLAPGQGPESDQGLVLEDHRQQRHVRLLDRAGRSSLTAW
jgi:hypothetical protein